MGITQSILLTLILLINANFALATSPIDVVIYGDAHYAPYSWEKDEEIIGIYPTILRRAFSKMDGFRVELKPVPWKRGLHYLQRGIAFALFPPYYHPKLRTYISPYSEPILSELTVLVCHKDIFQIPRHKWPEDYFGLLIGVNRGYELGGEQFYSALRAGKIRRREIEGTPKNLLMVASGRIDCYINDINAIEWDIKLLRLQPRYHSQMDNIIFGPIISSEQGYLGFSNQNDDEYYYKEEFISQFNQIIVEMKKSGEIKELVREFYHHHHPSQTKKIFVE